MSYLILRNMQVAGVFIGKRIDDHSLCVKLDYVTPEYRDYKLGKFIYDANQSLFKQKEIKTIISGSYSPKNDQYLKKLGFEPSIQDQKVVFIKHIE